MVVPEQALLLALATTAAATNDPTRPNFIFIMTDDQDLHLNSLDYQPAVQKHFAEEGTWFKKHFCTVALCCPSRVSLWTGKAAHNTNITDVSPPYGGYPRFVEEGFNDDYFPVWMQDAGYNTYYTGKMMNGHSTTTYNNPRMAGWNGSDFLLDPGTYIFYNTTMSRNHEPYRNLPGQYSTDLISAAAHSFLDEAMAANDRPFFLGIAPIAPHSETIVQPGPAIFNPPVPAKRHEHLFENVTVPRTPSFNPDTPGSASYRKTLRQLNQTELDYNDHWYRRRLQSLQSVDDLITSLLARLHTNPKVLQTTYLIYTTDNGFHLGQHRLPPGKTTNIEHDINIPFFIRGPGIPKNKTSYIPTSHTDLVPTIFHLAGIPQRADFDGAPVPVRVSDAAAAAATAPSDRGEHVNVEFWGGYAVEGNAFYGRDRWGGNTYKSVRVVGGEDGGFDLSFTVWCTNEVELYDLRTDPHQLTNLYPSPNTTTLTPHHLTARLNALLLTLKRCKSRTCTHPWETLHPDGSVKSLADAMDAKYDAFYERQQQQVSFAECALGQVLGVEGALEPRVWRGEGEGEEGKGETG